MTEFDIDAGLTDEMKEVRETVHRFAAEVVVGMLPELIVVHPSLAGKKRLDRIERGLRRTVDPDDDLHAIAGGEDQPFLDTLPHAQPFEGPRDLFLAKGELFAKRHRRAAMAATEENQHA